MKIIRIIPPVLVLLAVSGTAAAHHGGETERWEIASISAPGLRRFGVERDTFKPGDTDTFIGGWQRDPKFKFLHSQWFIHSDRREFRVSLPKGEQAPLSVKEASAVGVGRIAGGWRPGLGGETGSSSLSLSELGLFGTIQATVDTMPMDEFGCDRESASMFLRDAGENPLLPNQG